MADDNPFEFLIEKVTAYRPKAGDVLVFRHPGRLSATAHEHIREGWKAAMEGTGLEGIRALILEEGMTLEVVRPDGD